MKVGTNVSIHPTVLIRGAENIAIGNNVNINHGTELYGGGGISIGDDSMIAYNVMIFSDSRKFRSESPLKSLRGRIRAKVVIGNDVWIGAGAILLPGVHINDHAVVGAGSLVSKDVDSWCIVGGNPASVISNRLEM